MTVTNAAVPHGRCVAGPVLAGENGIVSAEVATARPLARVLVVTQSRSTVNCILKAKNSSLGGMSFSSMMCSCFHPVFCFVLIVRAARTQDVQELKVVVHHKVFICPQHSCPSRGLASNSKSTYARAAASMTGGHTPRVQGPAGLVCKLLYSRCQTRGRLTASSNASAQRTKARIHQQTRSEKQAMKRHQAAAPFHPSTNTDLCQGWLACIKQGSKASYLDRRFLQVTTPETKKEAYV